MTFRCDWKDCERPAAVYWRSVLYCGLHARIWGPRPAQEWRRYAAHAAR